MSEWQGNETPIAPAATPRINAMAQLITQLEQNDSAYLAMEIDRAKWMEVAESIDERLAVIGLRLSVRPWRTEPR